MDTSISNGTLICFSIYAGLAISLITQKHPNNIKVSLFLLFTLLLSSAIFELLKLPAMPYVAALYFSSFMLSHKINFIRKTSLFILIALSLAFSLHLIPGFKNEIIFLSPSFGLSEQPYKLNANLDKALAAIAIILAMRSTVKWKTSIKELYLILTAITIFFTVSILFDAKPDPKLGAFTLAFIFFNLSVTCLAEEVFFRLIIQDWLFKFSKGALNGWLAVFITAVIFMLAHFHTGVDADKRLFLIFIAGILYGGIYLKNKSLGSAIIMHFGINIIHFSFFAYPATFN